MFPGIPISILRALVSARILKPGVLVGGVIDHKIYYYPYAALTCTMRELDKIAERPIGGIDPVIVGNVIPVVAAGRGLERHQPNRSHAEALQIVQPPHQALKISNSVTVGIHVGANRQAVEY